jgi:hypothetical protein
MKPIHRSPDQIRDIVMQLHPDPNGTELSHIWDEKRAWFCGLFR